MIVFGPKRKPPRRAAQSGSSNPSPPPSTTSTPPSLPQSRPLRRAPSDPPPYTLYPPERNPPRTLAPTPTTPPRQNGPPSRVAIDSSQATGDGPKQWQPRVPDALRHRISLCDLISSKLDAVITSIDGEVFSGDERELAIYEEPSPAIRGGGSTSREVSNRAITSAIISTNYFTKVNLYANSRLPSHLPELKLYMPSYPLVCLAAQYSQRVYTRATGKEREAHVDADWRHGTKAMVIKSVPIDDMNTVVFAIRGSQTFLDWAVNLNSAPASPDNFLDDPGNLCHSGFLSVARKMIKPVASRLRALLEEDPTRSSCSLLITGHSAGGAVASLLYAHMFAEKVKSELNILTSCFKRIHCVTFGTPPISLLPITKPPTLRHKKSLFLSFINEGDPVPRADKAYVRSLLDLYASPAPGTACTVTKLLPSPTPGAPCKLGLKRPKAKRANSAPEPPARKQQWIWKVPPSTLSNAGRLVVLRSADDGRQGGSGAGDDVRAEVTCDQELRVVVFGDPVMHMMRVYARRVEVLATKAVTAKVWG